LHRGVAGPSGGLSPTAYLVNFRGGESAAPASPVNINWITDDDVGVSNVDVLLSTDSGNNFDVTLASAITDNGTLSWSPPNVYTPHARIKVVARDGLGNTGFDASPADFTITGATVPGDMNCDAHVTLDDVDDFVTAILDITSFKDCNVAAADTNGDSNLDGLDVAGFVQRVVP